MILNMLALSSNDFQATLILRVFRSTMQCSVRNELNLTSVDIYKLLEENAFDVIKAFPLKDSAGKLNGRKTFCSKHLLKSWLKQFSNYAGNG